MRNDELALQLARLARVTPAEAADQLDIVVHDILRKLRHGKPATLPGLGKLIPDSEIGIRFTGVKSATKRPPKTGGRK